ncbi:hypothetical protein FCIRC_8834 [Fusarium circinatum]|uniref:Uncharacterized protein n=1 Tax=Fusarium circinatum TaxID=48490 RepID=A0A8H5TGY8_FUSCI|nr:hypothetical protein FCIRC_8834 [Fusarium circinatum]
MRFLIVLAFVSTCLAVAIEPLSHGTDKGTDSLLEHIPRNSDHESVAVVRSGVQASDATLEKRLDDIQVPYNNPNPKNLIMAGVVVSFTMAGQWVKQGGSSVYRYVCKSIVFQNPTARHKVVTLIANGAALLENQPLSEHRVFGQGAPEGGFGETIEIVVGNRN